MFGYSEKAFEWLVLQEPFPRKVDQVHQAKMKDTNKSHPRTS